MLVGMRNWNYCPGAPGGVKRSRVNSVKGKGKVDARQIEAKLDFGDKAGREGAQGPGIDR